MLTTTYSSLQAESLAVTDNPEELITAVTSQLTEATQQAENNSLLPQDLNTTNLVISSLLDITEKRNLSVDLVRLHYPLPTNDAPMCHGLSIRQ